MTSNRAIRVEDALQGAAPPPTTSVGYFLALTAAAVMLPFLVIAYAFLIALVGYAMFEHATRDISWFSSAFHSTAGRNPRAILAVGVAYAAPLVAGAVTVLFMLKPFFARRVDDGWPVPLDPREQRVFFALVGRLAALLGAPPPSSIEIDAEPNASARLESILSNRLVLRVGMPLVLCLSARQLLGVVAHELGHFRQGTGMRLSNLVRRAIGWLMGAVYSRDEWDEALEEAAASDSGWISILAHLARLAVWLSRRVLWVLAHIGLLVTAALLRQMEYDADRAEAAIAGTAGFADAMQEFQRMAIGATRARIRLVEGLRNKHLPDDIPALIAAESRRVDAGTMAKATEQRIRSSTKLFDSHPSDAARIAAVGRLRAPYAPDGVVRVEAPAAALFHEVDGLCKVVTVAEYRERLGGRLDHMQLQPTEIVVKRGAVDDKLAATMERYFGTPIHAQRPFPIRTPSLAPPAELERAAAALAELRDRQRAAARVAKQAIDEFHAARGRVLAAMRGQMLLSAGLSFRRADFGFEPETPAVASALERATAEQEFAAERLDEFERASADRVVAALALGLHDAVRTALKNADDVASIAARLPPVLVTLNDAHHELLQMHTAWCVLEVLLDRARGGVRSQRFGNAIVSAAQDLHASIVRLKRSLDAETYPFATRGEATPLGEVIVGPVPSAENIAALAGCVQGSLDRCTDLRNQILGRLALAAEAVERVVLPQGRSAASSGDALQGAKSAQSRESGRNSSDATT